MISTPNKKIDILTEETWGKRILMLDVLHGYRLHQRISDIFHVAIALPLVLAACLYGALFVLFKT